MSTIQQTLMLHYWKVLNFCL